MYLVMNRFNVPVANAEAFDELWLSRESYLEDMDGFVSFHMLKGPEEDGQILYASHTVWESEAHFQAWTRSDAFRAAHANAGESPKLHEGAPRLERFEAIQEIAAAQPA